MNAKHVKINILAVCTQCRAMFSYDNSVAPEAPLPCGHAKTAILTTDPLDAFVARDMFHWLYDNEMIVADAEGAITCAGGQYTSPHQSMKVPSRDLTYDERDRYMDAL